jgi:hypothetical protein
VSQLSLNRLLRLSWCSQATGHSSKTEPEQVTLLVVTAMEPADNYSQRGPLLRQRVAAIKSDYSTYLRYLQLESGDPNCKSAFHQGAERGACSARACRSRHRAGFA